jgi:hypothetical protein
MFSSMCHFISLKCQMTCGFFLASHTTCQYLVRVDWCAIYFCASFCVSNAKKLAKTLSNIYIGWVWCDQPKLAVTLGAPSKQIQDKESPLRRRSNSSWKSCDDSPKKCPDAKFSIVLHKVNLGTCAQRHAHMRFFTSSGCSSRIYIAQIQLAFE